MRKTANVIVTSTLSRHGFARKSLATAVLLSLAAGNALAGASLSFGEDKSVGLGLALRDSYTSASNASPSGTSRSSDFNLDSISLMVSASLNKNIKAYFSSDRDADGNVKLKDGYAQFDITPGFNVLAGRVLPPSDRANLDGPYYGVTWAYPGVASQYPGKAFGRDDGVVAWGKLLDKRVVYSIGAFEGRNRNGANTSSQDASLLYAGRVAVNLWDAEPAPLYYTGSTYYGSADILTVALVGMSQKDGVGNKFVRDDYSAWNVDVLMEKKLSAGVLTLEGAYYQYKFNTAAAAVDVSGGVTPGKASLADAAFLFPAKVGWGQFQPYVRYQQFETDGTGAKTKQADYGLNYIIDGSNAKLSATYTKGSVTTKPDTNSFVIGLQLQF